MGRLISCYYKQDGYCMKFNHLFEIKSENVTDSMQTVNGIVAEFPRATCLKGRR